MFFKIINWILIAIVAGFAIYWIGRIFASGFMDGINNKLNQYIKRNDNEEKK